MCYFGTDSLSADCVISQLGQLCALYSLASPPSPSPRERRKSPSARSLRSISIPPIFSFLIIPSNKLLSLYATEPEAARRVADWDASHPRRSDGRSASTSKAYEETGVHPLLRVSPLKSSPAAAPSCSYSLFGDLTELSKKEQRHSMTSDYPDYLDQPQTAPVPPKKKEMIATAFPGVFPLVRASPFGGGLTNGTPVKKRRSSSSPEDSTREKVPHLDQQPSTSTGLTGQKDVNITAELFWLKTQLAEQWPIKWLWQVGLSFLASPIRAKDWSGWTARLFLPNQRQRTSSCANQN